MTQASESTESCHDTIDPIKGADVTEKSGRGTARQTIRAEVPLWERFGQAVKRRDPDGDRSAVLREFMRWYSGDTDAKLPQRPTPGGRTD